MSEPHRWATGDLGDDLGDDVPGLNRATEHIMIRMSIALDDLLGERQGTGEASIHDREWFEEEMRQTIRYFVWLYVKGARSGSGASERSGSGASERQGEATRSERNRWKL